MKKAGRNEPCPCGSGKKYKNCHMKSEGQKEGNSKTFMIGVIIALFVIAAAIGLYFDSKNDGRGQAPPGKVWSEEHGHYH